MASYYLKMRRELDAQTVLKIPNKLFKFYDRIPKTSLESKLAK